MLCEAKQGVSLLKSLNKSLSQKNERLETALTETKATVPLLESKLQSERELSENSIKQLKILTERNALITVPTEVAHGLQELQKAKEISDDKEDVSRNVREYLEQKVTNERTEKMVYRELVEKLKSWAPPELSKLTEEFLVLTRQLSVCQRIKSQGLEDMLDVSHSKEDQLQHQKELVEQRLESAFSRISMQDSAQSPSTAHSFPPQEKEQRSVRPSFSRQAIDSPSVRSSSFITPGEGILSKDKWSGAQQGVRDQWVGRLPTTSGSSRLLETEIPSRPLNKEYSGGQFLSSASPKIAPSPARSPLDKMMEDHSLNFTHLRDKLKDIKAKLNS